MSVQGLLNYFLNRSNAAKNAINVELTGRKATIRLVSIIDSTAVNAGGTAILSTTVPVGKKWTIKRASHIVLPPASATTGTHLINVNVGSTNLRIAMATAQHNARVQYTNSAFYDTNTQQYMTNVIPDDHNAQSDLFRDLELQNGVDLTISYTNNTDVQQTNSRSLYLLVREEDIING
jgi:hypothetical protein